MSRRVILVSVVAIGSVALIGALFLGPDFAPLQPPASPTPTPRWAAVADMPVLTVAEASQLLANGDLAGRAVAVGGFWAEMFPSCPMPNREPAELEGWCRMVAFSDIDPHLCERTGDNGVTCNSNRAGGMKPIPVTETSRQDPNIQATGEAQRIVLIGHSQDPRLWHCAPDVRDQCAVAFVVDYMALPDQPSIEIRPPDTGVRATMTLAEAEAAAHVDPGSVIAAAAVKAPDVARIDPRFNIGGDHSIWVIRSIRPSADANSPTRSATVTLVDDSTAVVIDVADQQLEPDFQPARLAVDVRRPGTNGSDGIEAFYQVKGSDSEEVAGGEVGGGQFGTPNVTQHGPGTPLILGAGDYELTAWLSRIDSAGGAVGDPLGKCATKVMLRASDNVEWSAEFAALNGSCEWLAVPPDRPRL